MRIPLGSGTEMTLPQALDALYASCATHPKPGRLDDSYGPLDPAVSGRVMTTALRELGPADARALFQVLIDDREAYAHFYPRLMEIAARPDTPFPYPDLPSILLQARRLGILAVADVATATKHVLSALWDIVFTRPLDPETLDDIVLGSAWVWESLQSYLDAWATVENLGAQANLGAYVLVNLDSLRTRRRLRNDRDWEDRPQLEIEVGDWIRSRALADRVCHLARTTGEPRLVEACAGLRDLHTAPTFR
jgi:hypothetical protein